VLDQLIEQTSHALTTSLGPAPQSSRKIPTNSDYVAIELDDESARHAAGLMRINHAGEVCAQALYLGQAMVASDNKTREHLLLAAQEEQDHLSWCANRLAQLNSSPSALNPFWYAGSFTIGASAALLGDRWSLGFVIETERQVEAHLGEHLESLPANDLASRSIVREMQADEIRHGKNAEVQGGINLPQPIPGLMKIAASMMKALAYRI
jgi:3-demethoxyubiquinol 3-hydroxylase